MHYTETQKHRITEGLSKKTKMPCFRVSVFLCDVLRYVAVLRAGLKNGVETTVAPAR